MRRFAFLIATFVLAISQMSAQNSFYNGTITLSHNGKETTFAYNKMGDAVEAAADGDTIYLSAGEFEGDFRLTKKIAFIGSGADGSNGTGTYTRYYSGNIVITLPENTKLAARLFDGIYFDNTFTFQSAIDNVIIRKCHTPSYYIINANMNSIYFDRCDIQCASNLASVNIKKLIARNCQIGDLSMHSSSYNEVASSWQFIHCTIDPLKFGWKDNDGNFHNYCQLQGIYTNCIIDNDDTGSKNGYELYNPIDASTSLTAAFINCLFYKPVNGKDIFNGATTQNNMFYEAPTDNNSDLRIYDMTKEKLLENNFLGNDETVVGCYGGKNPYSLKMSQPTISSSKVHFDKDNKQIQIKMKVSSEQ